MQTTYHVAPAVPGGGLSETFTMMSLGFQLSRTKSNLESYNKRTEFFRKERTSGLYGDPQPQALHKATPRECFYGPCSNTLAPSSATQSPVTLDESTDDACTAESPLGGSHAHLVYGPLQGPGPGSQDRYTTYVRGTHATNR
jgi:hypothetical protein